MPSFLKTLDKNAERWALLMFYVMLVVTMAVNREAVVGDRAIHSEVEDEDAVGAFDDEDAILVINLHALCWG